MEVRTQSDSCDETGNTAAWWDSAQIRSDSAYDWRMVMDGYNLIRKDKYERRGEDLELYTKGDLDCTDHKKPEPHMSGDSVYQSEEKLTLISWGGGGGRDCYKLSNQEYKLDKSFYK